MTYNTKVLSVLSALAFGSLELAAGAQASEKTVLFMVPALNDEAYILEMEAAKKKAAEYPDISFEFTAMTQRDAAPEFIEKIEGGITRGVNVIVIDSDGANQQMAPALRKAMDAGVKVVVNAQVVPGLTPDAQIEYDQHVGAIPAGKFMASHLKRGDKIAVIRCYAGNAQMDARLSGFMEGLSGSGVEVVAEGETHCDPTEGRKLMENWLSSHPDLKGVYSDTDIALMGAVEALKVANVDLVVVGHDGQTPAVKLIAAGEIMGATVIYPNSAFGSLGVETAAKILAGETVPARVLVPAQGIITKDNAAEYLKP